MSHNPDESDDEELPLDEERERQRKQERPSGEEGEEMPVDTEEIPEEEEEEAEQEQKKARQEADAARTEEEIERSKAREGDAKDVANPDRHRDENPES